MDEVMQVGVESVAVRAWADALASLNVQAMDAACLDLPVRTVWEI